MSYKKRKESPEVEKAKKRLDGIRSIDSKADLGNGLTCDAYEGEIKKVNSLTEEYNTLLSQADGILSNIEQAEKDLGEFSQRMLNGVGNKYGYDSIEYEKAGGTRKSEKKKTAKSNNAKKSAA